MLENHAVVIMGVSGSGKTTIGELLSARLGCDFIDADSLHPAENREKLRNGIPLTDDDRWPWLEAVRNCIKERTDEGKSIVVACSALKQAYRDFLAEGGQKATNQERSHDIQFVYLSGDISTIRERREKRRGHFMNPSLLESQFATLEPPVEAIVVDVDWAPEEIIRVVLMRLKGGGN